MLLQILVVIGMIAVGVLVWKLLKKQEDRHTGRNDRQREGRNSNDPFGW